MTTMRTREAREEDIGAIREIFLETYGEDYPYRDFYDSEWLKRAIYGDHMLMVVAEDTASGSVLGTGSVDLDIGAHSDLVGELGRLAVHPDARGHGVGTAIMRHRLQLVEGRLHTVVAENRTRHGYSQRISHHAGLAPVGFLPLKHLFHTRESIAPFVRHFGPALKLRSNNPRVVPMVARIAQMAMTNLGMDPDVIVDETLPPYPPDEDFELSELESEGMPDLLRIKRGRVLGRNVFGPMRLHYGFFKLRARQASYLVARRPGAVPEAVAGGLGFLHDSGERNIRIFELIASSDEAIRHLFAGLLERARALGVEYVEVDVSAHGPRLQRTLLELGFLPAAYVPALAFHEVERLDAVKMVHLLVPPVLGDVSIIDEVRPLFDEVMAGFRTRAVLPGIAAGLEDLSIVRGLSDEQARRLASQLSIRDFGPDETLFSEGDPAEALFFLLEGAVEILRTPGTSVGWVSAGETVGERAMLSESAHSVTVTTRAPTVAGVLTRDDFWELAARRPDIAVILYRNLAVELGGKLLRTDGIPDRSHPG
ncbi:MAG: GNAT family N-acetyltransferase [Gemmatimonadota bacterium]